jgi:cell division transport system ATP-binding protein
MGQRIDEVLEAVGMSDKSIKMPHELSGGEQQRIAIARAILNHPKLILADEPTGNLDPETADGIMQLLRHISQTGTAVVMSTHNMPLLDHYPGIVYHCTDGIMEEVTGDYNKMKLDEEQA